MKYTSLRVPSEVWDRIKTHADKLNKSTTATGVECIRDCLDEMDKKDAAIPKIVQLFHFLKKK